LDEVERTFCEAPTHDHVYFDQLDWNGYSHGLCMVRVTEQSFAAGSKLQVTMRGSNNLLFCWSLIKP